MANADEDAAAADEATLFIPRNGDDGAVHDSLLVLPPPEAPALLSDADRATVERLQNNPTLCLALQTLLNQSPAVLGTLLHSHQVPLFSKDASTDRSNLIEKVQQTGEHIQALAAHHDAKENERSKSEKNTMFFGQGRLPDDLFRLVIGFLDKPDMAPAALVCYDWAEACLSPSNTFWQSVDFHKTGELVEDGIIPKDFAIPKDCAKARLLIVLKRPQFALVKELDYEFTDNSTRDLVLLKQVASLCPKLQILHHTVCSSTAAEMPKHFRELTRVADVQLDDAGEVVQYARGIGDLLERLDLSPLHRKYDPREPLGDDHVIAISKSCPNLKQFHVLDHAQHPNLSAKGLMHLVKRCSKLEVLDVIIPFSESVDWEDFLPFLSQNAPSLTYLSLFDQSIPLRIWERHYGKVRQLVKKWFGDRFVDDNPLYTFKREGTYIFKSQGT